MTEVDITLRLRLVRGEWSRPDDWNWTDLLGLQGSEHAEVLDYKGVRWIFPDGSVWEDPDE
jgi:hypothetical protein